ncbi:NAD(P)/FAD-dependent oxidoreductase [Sedimentitalea sp. CY04]|uniref:NAD(P)/FAD-dependent oxidoreductase n=1 Tax=Parasedimentitalea denitrificans TaxID=2211118 RepID=A0ABX0WFV2_9RHOB|nr:NAD(P)/FAD-dependent oxidoreductase [Sedimentitalea sp. CY04]NIZ63241.1 NAD(P)/FAD-dependent oxidoreductase [Sedimentitalea sp. CY04]
MTQKFDIIIIGGGNAGFGVSAVAHDAGKSIAFIEERDFGGTCPNRGCTPKKVLVAAAHALHEIETANAHCIEVGKPKLDWSALIRREKAMIDFIPDAMGDLAAKRGTVFRGRGAFTGPNSVEVNGQELTADSIVIATGSRPRQLPIPGAEYMITSDEVLSDENQPKEVVFIGGGVIAMEFSHVYARAGTKVTILEAMPQLLPRMDVDTVNVIKAESERLGIVIHTGVKVEEITKDGETLSVKYSINDQDHVVAVDRIVNGAGRIANTDGLNLDVAGIEHDGIAIKVDEIMRSVSNPSIWVAGDALVNTPQLSPVATHEGRLIGKAIVSGSGQSADFSGLPSCVYTVPAISTVGLTEAEAHSKGIDFRVSKNDMTGWFSGKSYAESAAWAKVLIDNETDQFLGAHMVGHQGEDLIHLFAMAMQHKITAAEFQASHFAFPTFSSDAKNLF